MAFFYCTKKHFASVVIALITAIVAGLSHAEEQVLPATPHETIERVSTELLSDLNKLLVVYEQSPEDFYAAIDAIVSPWIDYDSFYKGVMSKKYYTAATDEQRASFKKV